MIYGALDLQGSYSLIVVDCITLKYWSSVDPESQSWQKGENVFISAAYYSDLLMM
jgi:hypothetical protein